MIAELAKYSEADFVAAFLADGVAETLALFQTEYGIEVARAPRKADTLRALYAAVQAQALENPQAPPTVDPSPSEGAAPSVYPEGGRVFQVRSRQPQGRWRANRFFGKAFEAIPQNALRPEEWTEVNADPALEVREG